MDILSRCRVTIVRSDERKRLYRLHTFLASFPRDTWRESSSRLRFRGCWSTCAYCTKSDGKWMPFTHASTFLTPGSSSVDRCISTILTIYFSDINRFIHLTFKVSFFPSFFTITVIILIFFPLQKVRFCEKLDKARFFFLSNVTEESSAGKLSKPIIPTDLTSPRVRDLNVSLFPANILSRFSSRLELFISRNNIRVYTSGTCA